jgi:hypothetical protein
LLIHSNIILCFFVCPSTFYITRRNNCYCINHFQPGSSTSLCGVAQCGYAANDFTHGSDNSRISGQFFSIYIYLYLVHEIKSFVEEKYELTSSHDNIRTSGQFFSIYIYLYLVHEIKSFVEEKYELTSSHNRLLG